MKCANPLCEHEELYFRSGTLHSIDCAPAEYLANGHVVRQKVIWLCEECSGKFIVNTWRAPGEQLQLRERKRPWIHHGDREITRSAA